MKKSSLLMLAATGGWVASGSAATVYNESTGGDLSNQVGSPTVLTSGTDNVIGALHSNDDRNDHFIISDLLPGGTAQFDFTAMNVFPDFELGVFFTFSDPAGVSLFTSSTYYGNASATTGDITVPASGQVKVSVQNVGDTFEGSPITTWSVSTNGVVPETSVTALAALGALLALRRNRS